MSKVAQRLYQAQTCSACGRSIRSLDLFHPVKRTGLEKLSRYNKPITATFMEDCLQLRVFHQPYSALLHLIAALSILSGCAHPATGQAIVENTIIPEEISAAPAAAAATEAQQPTPVPTATIEPTPVRPVIWLGENVPAGLKDEFTPPGNVSIAAAREQANLWLEISPENPATYWVYAVAAPFPSVVDEISLSELLRAWRGSTDGPFAGVPLMVSPETLAVFEDFWGPANPQSVRQISAANLLETAWKEQPAWAILPFEAIEPRWKILRVDGQSPLDRAFNPQTYPLAVPFRFSGTDEAVSAIPADLALPTNRDPEKLTVLVMTGVTALSRHIGEVMEEKGVIYPARDIHDWLTGADLTHISNEVSFYKDCPKPGPLRADMRFCSHPKYIQLLEYSGTDIVELTGNHNLDWGFQPYFDTLEMYRQRGWKTFGGGANLKEAQRPLHIEHNGNRLVFIGCSPAGPEAVWAAPDKPGSAPCQMEKLESEIQKQSAEGYLPIVTLQSFESDTYQPSVAQAAPDFRRLARAGAVIVSGSASHFPQTMTFVGSRFVHYGLGNLFFDQMTPPETRQQFIDRHVFYDGRYLGVELLTTLLEESARPRPMTADERSAFLQEIFSLSDWSGE